MQKGACVCDRGNVAAAAIICFCLGVGLLLSLLFSSPFLTGVIGVFLLLCGIVLTQRK